MTEGQLLETAIANQLVYYGEICFYNKRNSSEIDFILNKVIAFEVKQKAIESDYKKLQKQAGELGVSRYFVISNAFVEFENTIYPWFL